MVNRIRVMEQHHQAVLAVIANGRSAGKVAAQLGLTLDAGSIAL